VNIPTIISITKLVRMSSLLFAVGKLVPSFYKETVIIIQVDSLVNLIYFQFVPRITVLSSFPQKRSNVTAAVHDDNYAHFHTCSL